MPYHQNTEITLKTSQNTLTKRVLCIHPNNDYNIGDLMTYRGAVHLMREAFDNVEMLQFDIGRAAREIDTYVPEYNWDDDVNVILLAGSPWLGQGDHVKVKMLEQATERWKDAKKIALGVGSCISHGDILNKKYDGINVDFIRDFDLIIVRDAIAEDILAKNDIDSVMLYDTAVYYPCKPKRTMPHKNILVYYDPFMNDVSTHLLESVWNEYIDYQLEWASDCGAMVIVITSGDKASLHKRKIACRFVVDLEWIVDRFSNAESILSGRVHMAILAKLCGCSNVSLLPVDSRYSTGLNADVSIVQPVEGLFPVWKGLKLSGAKKAKKTISKLLRKAINGKG